ncbi:MAG: 3-deoxy-manno-octulosonate cytidylyltransferase [Rikenellaceae bacterium]
MKFLAIIPSRFSSTRFPGKPLVEIQSRPMIQWVYERASEYFEHCYVATDDDRIFSAVENFNGKVVMTSTEHKSGTDRCAEALDKIEKTTGIKFDVVVNVQGDEPFICSEHLSLIKGLFKDENCQIATLVKYFSEGEDIFSTTLPKVVRDKNDNAIYFSRSVIPHLRAYEQKDWQKTHNYLKHIGLYAYKTNILREITSLEMGTLETLESLEQLRWIENGYKIKTALTDKETVAVDTPEDLERIIKML